LHEQKKRRGELATRDARGVMDRLSHAGSSPFPLGDWLGLLARADGDADLASLVPEVKHEFQRKLEQAITAQLARARTSMEAGKVVPAIETCDEAAALLKHLSASSSGTIRHDAENIVTRLLAAHGVKIELPEGEFTYGSQSTYMKEFVPVLRKALE